jgi:putative oxidoreductase
MTRLRSIAALRVGEGDHVKDLLEPYTDHAYALLRIVAGFLFAFHGMQKIFGVMTDFVPPFGTQLWLGGVIELACGLAVMLGVFTRPAAFLASGTMAVAYTQFHWKLQLGSKLFPAVNEGEPALIYAFLFLFIACRGARKWGIER